jgi:hypothetical protein
MMAVNLSMKKVRAQSVTAVFDDISPTQAELENTAATKKKMAEINFSNMD